MRVETYDGHSLIVAKRVAIHAQAADHRTPGHNNQRVFSRIVQCRGDSLIQLQKLTQHALTLVLRSRFFDQPRVHHQQIPPAVELQELHRLGNHLGK